jgi:hypothetical protein
MLRRVRRGEDVEYSRVPAPLALEQV